MKFNVTDIEFDYKESKLTFDEEIEIRDLALGVYEADDDNDLLDEITATTGYDIIKIYYDIQLEHYSLGSQDNTFIDINNTWGKY